MCDITEDRDLAVTIAAALLIARTDVCLALAFLIGESLLPGDLGDEFANAPDSGSWQEARQLASELTRGGRCPECVPAVGIAYLTSADLAQLGAPAAPSRLTTRSALDQMIPRPPKE